MSFNVKFFSITALFTATAICSFLGAYKLFSAPGKVQTDKLANQTGFYSEAKSDVQADKDTGTAKSPDSAKLPEEPSVPAALSQPDKITEDTVIVYEYYYEDDGKTERSSQKAPRSLLNLTREQLSAKIEGFSVEAFSDGEVVLRKKISASNANRYVLGVWNGKVAVFYGGSSASQSGLKEVTDTPVTSLSQEEQQRLTDGIIIEGDSQLMKVLEDYGS